jgi:hypothetical protein
MNSSKPTKSAPAAFASASLSGGQSTNTFFVLPVPCGSVTVPRIAWSAFLGSTPSRIWRSTEASNFVMLTCFTNADASLREYALFFSSLPSAVFLFLLMDAMINSF